MEHLLLSLHQKYSTQSFSLLRYLYRHHPRSTLVVFRRLDDLSRHIIRTLLGQKFSRPPDENGMQPLDLELSRFVRLGLQGFASDSLEAMIRFDIMSKASSDVQTSVYIFSPFLESLNTILSSHVDEPMFDTAWRPQSQVLSCQLIQPSVKAEAGQASAERQPSHQPAADSQGDLPPPPPASPPNFSINSYIYDSIATVESTPTIQSRPSVVGIDSTAAAVAREAVREQLAREQVARERMSRETASLTGEKPVASSPASAALGAPSIPRTQILGASASLKRAPTFTPPPRGSFPPTSLKMSVELTKRLSDINSQSLAFGWNRMLNALVEPPSGPRAKGEKEGPQRGARKEVDHKIEETYELLLIFNIIETGQLPRSLEERLKPGAHASARLTDKGNDFLLAETHDQVLEFFKSFAELFMQNWYFERNRTDRQGGWSSGPGMGPSRAHTRAQISDLHRLTTYLRAAREDRDPPLPLEVYLTEEYPLELLGCMCDLCTLSTDVLYVLDKAYIKKHLLFFHWLIHLGLVLLPRRRGDDLPYGYIAISNILMDIGGVRNAFTPLGEMRHQAQYGYVLPDSFSSQEALQRTRRTSLDTLSGQLPPGVSRKDLAGLAANISLITESTGRIYMYKSRNTQQNEVNSRILGMFARRVYDLPHMSCYQIRQELYKDTTLVPQEGALGTLQAEHSMMTFQLRQLLQLLQDQQRAAQRARAKPAQTHAKGPKCQLSAKRIGKYLVDKALRLTRPEDTANLRRPRREAFGTVIGIDGTEWDEDTLPVPVTLLNKLMLEEYTSQNAVILEGVRCIVFSRPAEVIRAERGRNRDARGSTLNGAGIDPLAESTQIPVTNLPEDFVYPDDILKAKYQHTVAQYAAYFITIRLAELSRNLVWFDKEIYARYSHRHTEMSRSRLYRGNFVSFNDLSLREIRTVEEIWRELDGMYAAAEAKGDKKLRVLIKEAGSEEFLRRVLAELRRISESFYLPI